MNAWPFRASVDKYGCLSKVLLSDCIHCGCVFISETIFILIMHKRQYKMAVATFHVP